MRPVTEDDYREVLAAYGWEKEETSVKPYGEGHINATRLVTVGGKSPRRYILQRINTEIFRNPEELMANICGISSHLRRTLKRSGRDDARGTMTVVPDMSGKNFYLDGDGHAWRVYRFVEGTVCLQKCRNGQDFYCAARAFGQFQRDLADYDAASLYETIPAFHDTPDRYLKFEHAADADREGRAADAADAIAFVRARREDCAFLTDLLKQGKLPLRVTHNDTKLNNILLDAVTGEALCVIDLDTVMPGLVANDYGDSIRFGANDCAEDEPDLSKVHFSMELYDIYTKGFLETAGEALTPLEIETLPWGARLMTLECGIRFLTDYLEGDHYFATSRPGQNLDRARTQFKLVSDMESRWDEMQDVIRKYMPHRA